MSGPFSGRLTQTQRGAGYFVDYEYDDANRLARVSGPAPDMNNPSNRLVTSYTRDARGRVIDQYDNTGRQQLFQFNAAGELDGFT